MTDGWPTGGAPPTSTADAPGSLPPTPTARPTSGKRWLWAVVAAAIAVLAGLGVGLFFAFGSSSGEDSKSATQILQDAKAATAGTSSVRITGSVYKAPDHLGLALVASNHGGGGTVSVNGATFQIVVSGQNAYVRADRRTLQQLTHDNAVSQIVAGRWFQTTSTDPSFGDGAKLTDLNDLTGSFSSEGSLSKGQLTTVNGQSAIPLSDPRGETVFVAADGPAYILRVQSGSGSSGSGKLVFDQYGSAQVPSAPGNAINLNQLSAAG